MATIVLASSWQRFSGVVSSYVRACTDGDLQGIHHGCMDSSAGLRVAHTTITACGISVTRVPPIRPGKVSGEKPGRMDVYSSWPLPRLFAPPPPERYERSTTVRGCSSWQGQFCEPLLLGRTRYRGLKMGATRRSWARHYRYAVGMAFDKNGILGDQDRVAAETSLPTSSPARFPTNSTGIDCSWNEHWMEMIAVLIAKRPSFLTSRYRVRTWHFIHSTNKFTIHPSLSV